MEKSPLQIAIERVGSQAKLASLLIVTPQAVNNWLRTKVPASRCRAIESITDGVVTVHQLRPDVFGPGQQPAAQHQVA